MAYGCGCRKVFMIFLPPELFMYCEIIIFRINEKFMTISSLLKKQREKGYLSWDEASDK